MKRSKMARPIAIFLAILLWLLSFPTSVAAADLSIETDTAPSLSTTLGGTQLNGPASRSYQGYITIKVYGPCGYLDQFQVYCDGTKIQSEWYTIPSLDFWLEGTPYENYDYGRVTGVTSVWYPDAKDKQVGQVVCWSSNKREYTMTYKTSKWEEGGSGGPTTGDFILQFDQNCSDTVTNMPPTVSENKSFSSQNMRNLFIPQNVPQREGYTFKGWYENTSGTGKQYNPGGSIYVALGTKTLYAKWEKDTEQTTVPLTIQKVFSGIQAGQIPSNFYLTYTITNERGSSDVISLDRSSATLTTYNGSPALTWVIQIPSGITNTLQFTEYNATLDNYSHRASAMEFIIDSNFSGGTKTITNTYTQTPVTTYTVVYTDGVEGEEIFPNQTFSNLSLGDPTPAFDGTPSRSGYTFLGWDPEPSETVLSSVTYVAQWEKLDEPTPRPGISYQIVPANRNDSALWSIPTTQTKINPSMGGLR